MKRLSKSKLMAALQCLKRVNFEVNHPELREISASTRAAFAIGHTVGDVAHQIYGESGAAFVEYGPGMANALKETKRLMAQSPRRPIFEATFQHGGVLVRADVLLPQGDGWRIVEVKASAGAKAEHLPDCAIQAWVFAGAGNRLKGVALAYVDTTWVYPGGEDYSGLLNEVDLTDLVRELRGEVPHWVRGAQRATETMPELPVGAHCFSPYECPFLAQCWPADVEYPVQRLGGKKDFLAELANDGFRDIREVPAERLAKPKHQRIRRVTHAGTPELLPEAGEFARRLPYPRFYLDFETMNPAIPVWPGTRPYEALPIQWSCLVEEAPGEVREEDFLDLSGEPPMRALAERLLEVLGDHGPILAYSPYEVRVIRELAERFPDLEGELLELVKRVVDLLPVAKAYYYHPQMLGSWSIKAVLPTIAPDMRYEDLEGVQEGTEASAAYLEAIRPETTAERRAELDRQLRVYCRFDTEAMRRLVEFFATAPR